MDQVGLEWVRFCYPTCMVRLFCLLKVIEKVININLFISIVEEEILVSWINLEYNKNCNSFSNWSCLIRFPVYRTDLVDQRFHSLNNDTEVLGPNPTHSIITRAYNYFVLFKFKGLQGLLSRIFKHIFSASLQLSLFTNLYVYVSSLLGEYNTINTVSQSWTN